MALLSTLNSSVSRNGLLLSLILSLTIASFSSGQDDKDIEFLDTLQAKAIETLTSNLETSDSLALEILNCSIGLTNTSLRSDYMTKAYLIMAAVDYYHGNYNDALSQYKKVMNLAVHAKDSSRILTSYCNFGHTNLQLGKFVSAADNYYNALKYFTGDSVILLNIYGGLSRVHEELRQYDKAIEYGNKILELSDFSNNRAYEGLYLIWLGQLYTARGEYSNALGYFDQAEELFKEIENQPSVIQVYYEGLASLNFETGKYNEAYEYALTAVEKTGELGATSQLTRMYHLLAELSMIKGNIDEADRWNKQCMEMSREYNQQESLGESFKMSARIHKNKGEYDNAYESLSRFVEINDSIHSVKSQNIVAEYAALFEAEKKESEILENKLRINEQLQMIRQGEIRIRRNSSVIIILSLFLLTGILSYVNLKRKKDYRITILEADQKISNYRSIIQGQESERLRMSKELHDGLNGNLAAIHYKLESLKGHEFPQDQVIEIAESQKILGNAMQQIRNISHNLAPPTLFKRGFRESVRHFCELISSNSDLNVHAHFNGEQVELNDHASTALYRIIQELVTNAGKHAGAREVDININTMNNMLLLTVEDDGKGFQTGKRNWGLGLKSVQSRIESLMGEFIIDSNSKGSVFVIDVPLKECVA